MQEIPADAPRSADGYYWWDGSQWQPVGDQQSSADAQQSTADQSTGTQQSTDGQQSTADPLVCEDPNERQVAFDPGDYPTLMLYAEFSSIDDLLRHIGIDPALVQTDDEPVA